MTLNLIKFLTAQILVLFKRITLLTTLLFEGVHAKKKLQPTNPLVEPNYVTILKNQRWQHKRVLKKVF